MALQTCKCGEFGPHRMFPWRILPVLDFVKRVHHTALECYPFPEWTDYYRDEPEKLIGTHPTTFGINKMGFFHPGTEPHPDDCPCGGARGYGVQKHGNVCFIGCYGTYAHLEALDLDWDRQKVLALSPRREIKELWKYDQSDRCEGLSGSLSWPEKKDR
jgi:hypothetical protein